MRFSKKHNTRRIGGRPETKQAAPIAKPAVAVKPAAPVKQAKPVVAKKFVPFVYQIFKYKLFFFFILRN